jgi:hypothetical protein
MEPAAGFLGSAKPHEAAMRREAPRPFAPMPNKRADSPNEQGLAAPEGRAPGLAVAVPELYAVADSTRRPAPEPAQQGAKRRIEPDDRVSGVGDERAELAVVVAVYDPPVASGVHALTHSRSKLFGARLAPVRAVVQRVKLDVRHANATRELGRERRLARAACAANIDPRPQRVDATRRRTGSFRRTVYGLAKSEGSRQWKETASPGLAISEAPTGLRTRNDIKSSRVLCFDA